VGTHRETLIAALGERAKAGVVRFDDFVDVALFLPGVGYYTSKRDRVGRRSGTDFTTAVALGPIFGDLLASAAASMVGDTRDYTLVEIGAEPGTSVFASVAHRFANLKTLRIGEPLSISGKSIVIANELLDAQPFRRFRFIQGQWVDLGVRVLADGSLVEDIFGEPKDVEGRTFVESLPKPWHEGFTVDVALRAESLLQGIVKSGWSGAVIFLDYGKTLPDLLESSPQGTARAYYQHGQHNDLLANFGEQDLTCHVLWDRMESVLKLANFTEVKVERQEAFLVRHAADALERIVAAGTPESVGVLKALTHPAHFGGKFQVLSSRRH
jgi:SAM-dependent MidA family methyltransferase